MKVRTTLTWAALALVAAGSGWATNCQAETVPSKVAKAVPSAPDEVSGIRVPDSKLARDAAQVIRDAEGDLLFQHSMRVYYWAALAGKREGLTFDPALLYVAAMFHDYGLTAGYGESHLRYEVDGANAARSKQVGNKDEGAVSKSATGEHRPPIVDDSSRQDLFLNTAS